MKSTPPRKPFRAVRLPLLARCYRRGFRSGAAGGVSPPERAFNRLLFYFLLYGTRHRVEGQLALSLPDGERTASFNARNRQFSAIYFDYFAHAYEPEISAVIDACLPDDGVFYDIGANWGYFSFYAASRPGFRGQIHSFEPWPPSYEDLRSLATTLGLSEMIRCHPLALGAADGTAGMRSGSHSGLARVVSGGAGVEVALRSLDSLGLPPPHLAKIDVEGLEFEVLQGGRTLLERHHPALIFESSGTGLDWGPELAPLFFLEEIGYRLFAPSLVCRLRANGRELVLTERYDPSRAEFVRLEYHPFRAAERRLLRPYLNVLAVHPADPDYGRFTS